MITLELLSEKSEEELLKLDNRKYLKSRLRYAKGCVVCLNFKINWTGKVT